MALVYIRFRDPVVHPRTGGAEPVLRAEGSDGRADCVFEWQADTLIITAAYSGRWILHVPRSNVVMEAYDVEPDPIPPVLAPADVAPVDVATVDALSPLGKLKK